MADNKRSIVRKPAARLKPPVNRRAEDNAPPRAEGKEIMSDFNVREFYGRYVDVINAHQWDRVGDFMADTVLSHGQTVTREQGVAAFASITDAMPDYQVEVKELNISGDTVGSHAITRGTPVKEWLGVAPTGRPIEIDEVTVYKIRDGKFVQMSNVWDIDALTTQLAG